MSVPLSQVLASTRTYLNDDNSTSWTDPVLIPKIQEAHRELQSQLWTIGSPILREQSSTLAIPSNATQTNVTALNPTGFPTDMLNPTAVWEAASSPTTWTQMTENFYIPIGYTAAATLVYWSWQEENLIVAPCTAARSIVIQYRRSIPIPAVGTDLIGILFGESYLAPRAAAICAGAVGNKDVYTAMTALAQQNFNNLLMMNRGAQNPPQNMAPKMT
jgi:hypothetical protein